MQILNLDTYEMKHIKVNFKGVTKELRKSKPKTRDRQLKWKDKLITQIRSHGESKWRECWPSSVHVSYVGNNGKATVWKVRNNVGVRWNRANEEWSNVTSVAEYSGARKTGRINKDKENIHIIDTKLTAMEIIMRTLRNEFWSKLCTTRV